MILRVVLRRAEPPARAALVEAAQPAARPAEVPGEQAERAVQRPAQVAALAVERAVAPAVREPGVAGREVRAAVPGVRSLEPVGSGS